MPSTGRVKRLSSSPKPRPTKFTLSGKMRSRRSVIVSTIISAAKMAHFSASAFEPEDEIAGQEQQSGGQFHHRVHGRDMRFALAAAAGQQQPAHDRDIVVRLDWLAARWAVRWRQHDRFRKRYAQDADVQKAADDQAEKKDD